MRCLFRGFNDEFLEHVTDHIAWPPEDAINKHREFAMTHGAYKSLRDGNIESYDYVTAILACMRLASNVSEIVHTRKVLHDYLHSKGIPPTQAETMNEYQVAEFVCGPIRFRREKRNIRDAFEHWLGLLLDSLASKRPGMDYVCLCQSENDIRQAIDWMFIEAGRAVGGKRLSYDAARRRAESLVKTDLEPYTKRAIEWHDRNPWTVIQVHGDRKNVGMCINLPVPANVYDAVKRGERTSHSCTAQELEYPSSQLIAEGLALRPHEECDRSFADTRAMFYAVLCQQAKLTDIPLVGWEFPMRLLSFAATKANTRRLRWVGYKPVGAHMPNTGWEFYERSFYLKGDDRRSIMDAPMLGTWWKLQARLRGK